MARYDGLADWYDTEFLGKLHNETLSAAVRLLGGGGGRLLDLGCGTGAQTIAFRKAGWDVVGVDVSADMLRRARDRGLETVQADVADLPFEDATFDAVITLWTHSDVEDFRAAIGEGTRVLRTGGALVYLGMHPCFVGPHSRRFVDVDGIPELHDGYLTEGRYGAEAPGVGPVGVRSKIGAVHLTLSSFVHAFVDAGLGLERLEELAGARYPAAVVLRWRK
jgi:SAM-dependent methyltransferase